MVKIGPGWRAGDLEVESFESFHETWLADLEGGYVVGATPFAARGGRLNGVSFDTVIMDEASQITLPLAIMRMLKAERYLFVGD